MTETKELKSILLKELDNENEYSYISIQENDDKTISMSVELFETYVNVVLKKVLHLPGTTFKVLEWDFGTTYQVIFDDNYSFELVELIMTHYGDLVEVTESSENNEPVF